MTLLPGIAPRPKRERKPRAAPDLAAEPERVAQRVTRRVAWAVAVAAAEDVPGAIVVSDPGIRVLRDGLTRAWVDVEEGEYLLRWPRRPFQRSYLATTDRAELRLAMGRVIRGRSPDRLCLRLGCGLVEQHVGPCAAEAVPVQGWERQTVLPWG